MKNSRVGGPILLTVKFSVSVFLIARALYFELLTTTIS
jgi:hypothetical protein